MADSLWSLWSEDSLLSIGSKGSLLSIGSFGSALSAASRGSLLSAARAGAVLGEPAGPRATWLAVGILATTGLAVAWAAGARAASRS
jgi:hypothetical protein